MILNHRRRPSAPTWIGGLLCLVLLLWPAPPAAAQDNCETLYSGQYGGYVTPDFPHQFIEFSGPGGVAPEGTAYIPPWAWFEVCDTTVTVTVWYSGPNPVTISVGINLDLDILGLVGSWFSSYGACLQGINLLGLGPIMCDVAFNVGTTQEGGLEIEVIPEEELALTDAQMMTEVIARTEALDGCFDTGPMVSAMASLQNALQTYDYWSTIVNGQDPDNPFCCFGLHQYEQAQQDLAAAWDEVGGLFEAIMEPPLVSAAETAAITGMTQDALAQLDLLQVLLDNGLGTEDFPIDLPPGFEDPLGLMEAGAAADLTALLSAWLGYSTVDDLDLDPTPLGGVNGMMDLIDALGVQCALAEALENLPDTLDNLGDFASLYDDLLDHELEDNTKFCWGPKANGPMGPPCVKRVDYLEPDWDWGDKTWKPMSGGTAEIIIRFTNPAAYATFPPPAGTNPNTILSSLEDAGDIEVVAYNGKVLTSRGDLETWMAAAWMEFVGSDDWSGTDRIVLEKARGSTRALAAVNGKDFIILGTKIYNVMTFSPSQQRLKVYFPRSENTDGMFRRMSHMALVLPHENLHLQQARAGSQSFNPEPDKPWSVSFYPVADGGGEPGPDELQRTLEAYTRNIEAPAYRLERTQGLLVDLHADFQARDEALCVQTHCDDVPNDDMHVREIVINEWFEVDASGSARQIRPGGTASPAALPVIFQNQ